jgi:hypothetical protein
MGMKDRERTGEVDYGSTEQREVGDEEEKRWMPEIHADVEEKKKRLRQAKTKRLLK